MVNRVFVYSKEIAKQNKNNFNVLNILWFSILLTLGFTAIIITLSFVFEAALDYIIFLSLILVTIIIIYAIKIRSKMQAGLMGFATTENGDLFCAIKLNNGEEFAIGGIALGNIIDNVLGDANSALGNVAQAAGTVMTMYSLNKSSEIMQNPVVISKMVESANTLTGGVVNKILKVHDIKNDNKKITIIYDYQNMKTLKTYEQKKLTIYNSYNAFDDLVNLLNTKR